MIKEVREDYDREPGTFYSPCACSRSFLPRAGDGHRVRGVWPPKDVPRHIWQTLQDFVDAEKWGLREVLDKPDSWTMNAFRLLDQTANEIRLARHEAEERKRKRNAK